MNGGSIRRSFQLFHLTLGLALLYFSARTVALALHGGDHAGAHVALLALVEAVGAILFLLPWTLLAGGSLLLLTIVVAFVVHASGGQIRADLLVYAAATWFVMKHGAAWGGKPAPVGATAGGLH